MSALKNITGQVFGRLTVLYRAPDHLGPHGRKRAMWTCQCACGVTKNIQGEHLRRGATISCGCFNAENAAINNRTHGASRTPTWWTWVGMLARCKKPTHASWKYYGGRGIKVCERWQAFENFLADMGERPSSTHSIDRIDNEADYEPYNCRWATDFEQSRNTRRTKLVVIGNTTKCIADWCIDYGIDRKMVYDRINRWGWEAVEAITTPVKPNRRTHLQIDRTIWKK